MEDEWSVDMPRGRGRGCETEEMVKGERKDAELSTKGKAESLTGQPIPGLSGDLRGRGRCKCKVALMRKESFRVPVSDRRADWAHARRQSSPIIGRAASRKNPNPHAKGATMEPWKC